MSKYEVTKLGDKTPKAECDKLQNELKAVQGVDTVTMLPSEHRVSISFQGKEEPRHEALKAAATKAGFTLGAKV
jgi:cation transport ATPase